MHVVWKALLIGAFAFVIALLALALTRPSNQPQRPAYDQSASQGPPATAGPRAAAPWLHRLLGEPLNLFTAVLATATTLLVIVSIFQSAILIRADRTAARSARAAEDSAKTAKDALISVQRAFVFIAAFETYVVNDEFRVMPKWENSGSTPASPMTNWANWKTFPGEPPAGYTFPDLDANGNPAPAGTQPRPFFIGPRSTKFSHILKIPVATMEQVRAGRLRLFVWGWAQYNDAFPGTPVHRTEFCSEVVVTDMGQQDGKATVAVSFTDYGPHNSAN